MNLQFTNIQARPNGAWLFTWADTGALFYRVVLFGRVLNDAVIGTQYLYNQAIPMDYEKYPPPIEVVTNTDTALSEQFKPFILLQWYGYRDNIPVSYYMLQQYTSGKWLEGNKIADNGSYIYSITTPVLSDATTYNFRILAVGPNGQISCALPYQVTMVCCPRLVEPSIEQTYDDDAQSVVVSAAS